MASASQPSSPTNAGVGQSKPPLSEKLIAELTSHRTAALRLELANNREVATTALLHALAQSVFHPHQQDATCLRLTAKCQSLERHATGINQSEAEATNRKNHQHWAQRLPVDSLALWLAIADLSEDDRGHLLAHCVAGTVDTVQQPGIRREQARLRHADQVAASLSLDMRRYWQADTASYFGRMSRERVLDAVKEAVSKEAAENLSKLKKQPMADAATLRVTGKGWLPAILRPPQAEPQAGCNIRLAAE